MGCASNPHDSRTPTVLLPQKIQGLVARIPYITGEPSLTHEAIAPTSTAKWASAEYIMGRMFMLVQYMVDDED